MATLPTRLQAQASAITTSTLIHIVVTGDTSQSPDGSSYKATLGQLTSLFSGGTDLYITGGTYSASTLTLNRNDGGTISVSGFTEPFSGGSGNCIADLYVSNIHSCSPLNINPLDEGNVYFGSTSGVTIDVLNNRIGIGTATPTEKLDISGKTKTINFQMTSGATNGYVLTSDASGNASWQASGGGFSGYTYVTEDTLNETFITEITSSSNILSKFIVDPNGNDLGTGIYVEDTVNDYRTQIFSDSTTIDLNVSDSNLTSYESLISNKFEDVLGVQQVRISLGTNNLTGSSLSFLKLNTNLNTDISDIEIISDSIDVQANDILLDGVIELTSYGTGATVNTLGVDSNGKIVLATGTDTIDPYNNLGNVNTITWSVSGLSTNYQAALTGNTTLALTNVRNGDYGTIILQQDGVGGRTLTFGTVNGGATTHRVANGGGGSVVLTSNPNAIDILTFTYNGSVMFWTVGNDYT